MLFELIKGLIVDNEGDDADEVHMGFLVSQPVKIPDLGLLNILVNSYLTTNVKLRHLVLCFPIFHFHFYLL